jgi:hypothetical protein
MNSKRAPTRRASDPPATLTGTVAQLTKEYLILGRGGAKIDFGSRGLPAGIKVGDTVTVVVTRLGSKNLAEKITRV